MANLEAQSRAIRNRVDQNLKFAVARALTQTVKFASEQMTNQLPDIFDRPNQFTQRAIAFAPASRNKLQARVYVREAQKKYLRKQETGGQRVPERGSPINVPVGINLNAYGNITRGGIARKRQRADVFVASGKGRSKHLPPGLYQRAKQTKRKKAASAPERKLKMLVSFERRADYTPRFRFHERVDKIVQAKLKENLRTSIADAVRTMR